MRKIIISILMLSAMALSLTSCVKKLVGKVVEETHLQYKVPPPELYTDAKFDGLDKFIIQATDTANIVLTHGLTDKTENHFDLMVERLATRLKLRLILQPDTAGKPVMARKIVASGRSTNDVKNRQLGFESWKLFKWKFMDDNLKKPVNFYFVYWAPITKPAKDFIHKYNKTEYRTMLSSQVKDSLFINIFGDLALYLNAQYKLQLHRCFLESFRHIHGQAAIVGGGFGVQLMFEAMNYALGKAAHKSDTVLQKENRGINIKKFAAQEDLNAGEYTVKFDIWKVYLLTNQIPFVSLLTLQANDSPDTQSHNKHVLATMHNFCVNNHVQNLDIVSFYDPNDAFGFRLPQVAPPLHVINVRVNIAESWWIDPKKTTNLLLPQLKKQKASDLFLNIINQKDTVQELMLNLKGPAELTRNDYRVMGTLAQGSAYKLVCSPSVKPVTFSPRELETQKAKKNPVLESLGALLTLGKLKGKLEVKTSVLPFSLPSGFRDAHPTPIKSNEFEGIDSSILVNDITQVLTVHGVKNQEPDSFDDLINSIAKSLGFYSRPTDFKVLCSDGSVCPQTGPLLKSYRPGTVKVTTFTGVWGQKLIIYAVYWSSITKHPKEWLDEISIYDESSVVPKIVKRDLINDGFADIELSFGDLQGQVNATIETAFKAMDRDYDNEYRSKAKQNTYYVTGSLGSRLLLDYLNEHKPASTDVNSRVRSWFMLTNQLIMTALKDIKLDKLRNTILYEDYFKQSYGALAPELDKPGSFDIVAFNDPNDLLSFILPDSVMGISPKADKIYNNYLNLAQGVSINMDNLVKFGGKIDKKLKRYQAKMYKKQIAAYEKASGFRCGGVAINKTDVAYRDYFDMLKISGLRFQLTGYAPDTTKDINPDIAKLLADTEKRHDDELYDLFNKKQQYYAYNIFVTKDQKDKLDGLRDLRIKEQQALEIKSRQDKMPILANGQRTPLSSKQRHDAEKVGTGKVISKKHFDQMFDPGLLMPFIRSLSNNLHYQDFVSDFGRAHVGAKESSRVVQMISHGFHMRGYNAVTFTTVEQELYNDLHNHKQ